MTNAERYKKYKEEHCKNCKHKQEDLCEIRIFVFNDIITTKCVFYEKDKALQSYKKTITDKFNYDKCMRKVCKRCNRYNICFKNRERKNNNEV